MSNLKRYACLPNDSVEFEMVEDSTGPYVKFDDIKEFLPTDKQQLKAEIAALIPAVEACSGYARNGQYIRDIVSKMRQLSAV